ncbi:MAG TPA: PAS domain S-box protein [Methanoregulaceae archaeon]|nr:MAG: PAS domain S-box protein [Methanolinea sp.]HON81392.1 PAS domain S-box protein [Methanoregulaceae archaeon]HRT15086.1 PAS domain S-box protein [Methanoregulaceae archaeon]
MAFLHEGIVQDAARCWHNNVIAKLFGDFVPDSDTMESHGDQRINKIRDLLKSHPRGLSISEIADTLGLQRHLVSKDLGYLHKMGQVELQTIGTSKVYTTTAKVPLAGILDYFSDMILVLDEDFVIIEVNAPLLHTVNLVRNDVIGKKIYGHPSPLIAGLKPGAFPEGGIEELNVCLPDEDGSTEIHHFKARYVPMVYENTSPGMIIFIEDITKQTRYRDAFLLSEAHYKAIVENQAELIFRFLPDGTLTFTNWRCAQTFGMTESNIRGNTIFNFLPGNEADRFRDAIMGLTAREPGVRISSRLETTEGYRPYSIAVQAIHNDAGRLLGYHGIARDITAEQIAEEERRSHVAHLDFLCRSSCDFMAFSREKDLIQYLAAGIRELVPNAVQFIFTYDRRTREMVTKSIINEEGVDLLDTDFAGSPIRFPVSPSVLRSEPELRQAFVGKLTKISKELIASILGNNLHDRFSALTGERKTYVTLGIGEGEIVGAVAISLPTMETLENRTLVETFIRMGMLTYQRLVAWRSYSRSDNRFRIITEKAYLPIAIINPEGKYLYVNNSFIEMFGYTLEDIPTGSMWFLKAFPDADIMQKALDLWISDLKKSIIGEIRSRQFRVRCKDGSFKSVIFHPVTLPDGCQLVFYEDISNQEEAQKDRNLLAEIVRSSHDAIIGMTTSGRIKTWNPGAKRIFGYTAEEVVGRDIDIIFPQHRIHEKDILLKKVLQGEYISGFETERKKKDGRIIDVSVTISPIYDRNDQIIGISTIIKDISARKAEERLQKLESRYRDMVDSINVGVYRSTGDPEGRFLWGNTSLVRILGYPSIQSVQNVPVSDLFIKAHGREELLRDLREKGFVRNREILLKRGDGSVAYVLVTALATFGSSGEITYINGIVEDVTEQRVLARKLASLGNTIPDH